MKGFGVGVLKDYRDLAWNFSKHSSGGQYLKAEKSINGIKYYYKLSNYKFERFVSHEAILEVIVSRLGRILGFPVLEYTGDVGLVNIGNKDYQTYVTKSRNYCKSGVAAMPLATEYQLHKGLCKTSLEYCKQNGMTAYMDYVFLFDYLIMNTDRHGWNIEILHHVDGSRTISPIFDNGRCLTYACGNNADNIKRWQYKDDVTVNNFVGSLSLEKNLDYVSKAYTVPILDDAVFKRIFYGMSGVLHKEHIKVLRYAIMYRYDVLRKRGLLVCGNTI